MATTFEIKNAILKGMGIRPTSFLFRWEPTLKNPFNLGLLEVFKCNMDGGVVTPFTPSPLLSLHPGHRMGNPKTYSLWEFLKVQFRIIR